MAIRGVEEAILIKKKVVVGRTLPNFAASPYHCYVTTCS